MIVVVAAVDVVVGIVVATVGVDLVVNVVAGVCIGYFFMAVVLWLTLLSATKKPSH